MDDLNYIFQLKYDFEEPNEVPTVDKPHCPNSYLSVYRQVGLEEMRDPFDFLQRALMSVFLLKVLQRAGYFGEWDEEGKF